MYYISDSGVVAHDTKRLPTPCDERYVCVILNEGKCYYGGTNLIVESIESAAVQRFHAQVYRVNDVVGWADRNELVLSPSFQRRKVWSRQGKSYLIDTIARGMPIPQIFIREVVHPRERRTVREVVDGQQRISTILDYIDGKFTVMPAHNPQLAKLKYSELPEDIQSAILSFPLSVNILSTSDDAEVLDIFSRINSYSVTLNRQEKLNAKYTGAFKVAMHEIARRHFAFWTNHQILTSQQIARMGEVDLTADLVGTMMTELHDGKKHIESYYKKFDEEFPLEHIVKPQLDYVLSLVQQVVGIDIENTEFSRVPLFYSLYTSLHDSAFGFGYESATPIRSLNEDSLAEVNDALQALSDSVAERDTDGRFGEFVRATLSSTDKLPQRQLRHRALKELVSPAFN